MGLGSRLGSEEADLAAGFAIESTVEVGMEGEYRTRVGQLCWHCCSWAEHCSLPGQVSGPSARGSAGRWARDPGSQEKGTTTSKVPTFSLQRDVLACSEASALSWNQHVRAEGI